MSYCYNIVTEGRSLAAPPKQNTHNPNFQLRSFSHPDLILSTSFFELNQGDNSQGKNKVIYTSVGLELRLALILNLFLKKKTYKTQTKTVYS